LITAGEDKTVRVWDVEDRKQTGMLLGEIGAGEDGMIQTMAISRDGKYLIVLVWLDLAETHDAQDRETDVRVYELATGNLQARHRYPGTLQDLDFSPDGRSLAMVGNPKGPIL
jgi:WD40 repeat protein